MFTKMNAREVLNNIKTKYPIGTKVKLLKMVDPHPVPEGTIGIVTSVDDIGQIHVRWANGSSLALIDTVDEFTKV